MSGEVLALPYECWRWIPGYEGWYQVSTRGRVRSVDRWVTYPDGSKRFIKGRILKPELNKKGYLYVYLCRDGKRCNFRVHRLVAETWISNPENKPQVNHLDEQKTNNDVFNLEWVTAKENTNYGTGIERMIASQSKSVQALDTKTGVVVFEFPSIMEAGRNGFDRRHITECCQGKFKQHKGFAWRYK